MRQQPVEVVAHHRRLGRHRAHASCSFFSSARAFSRASLDSWVFLMRVFQLGGFVLAVLALAQFLLDRLQLLVEVVLALGLLHLPLDAVADRLLDLQHADLALHVGIDALQPLGDACRSPAVPASRRSSGCRCEATVSASLPGSSIWLSETSTSGGIFLLSLMYCSNCDTTERRQRLEFLGLAGLLVDDVGHRPGRTSRCR